MLISERLIDFYLNLDLSLRLPAGIEVMNPYKDPRVREICKIFFNKYYSDNNQRIFLLGINPGRFGAGVTGITFTDPVHLEKHCGIENPFVKKKELSSVFIYEMIKSFGGTDEFYSRFMLSAICPLGFIRNGKNLNYYDSRELISILKRFIVNTLRKQVEIAGKPPASICLGEGRNFWYLNKLNNEFHIFDSIISLPHPRWVMQYRFKTKMEYIREYVRVLRSLV